MKTVALRVIEGSGANRFGEAPKDGLPLAGLAVTFLCPMAQSMLSKTVRDLGGERVHHDLTSLPRGMMRVPDIAVLSFSTRRPELRQERALRELRLANPGIVTVCCDWTSGMAEPDCHDLTLELPATEEAMAEAMIAAEHLLRFARLKTAMQPAAIRNSLFGLFAARRKAKRATPGA